jgi:hypothetical protein
VARIPLEAYCSANSAMPANTNPHRRVVENKHSTEIEA